MNLKAPAVDDLTLNVTQEIHVRATLDATFAALLEEIPTVKGPKVSPCR